MYAPLCEILIREALLANQAARRAALAEAVGQFRQGDQSLGHFQSGLRPPASRKSRPNLGAVEKAVNAVDEALKK